MLAHDVRHGLPVLLLSKDSDNLRFVESAHFHEEGLKVRKLRLLLLTSLLSGEAYSVFAGRWGNVVVGAIAEQVCAAGEGGRCAGTLAPEGSPATGRSLRTGRI